MCEFGNRATRDAIIIIFLDRVINVAWRENTARRTQLTRH